MPAPTFLGARLAVPRQRVSPNPALNLAPFGRWTQSSCARLSRLALRYMA